MTEDFTILEEATLLNICSNMFSDFWFYRRIREYLNHFLLADLNIWPYLAEQPAPGVEDIQCLDIW